jgi:hypothetical protein
MMEGGRSPAIGEVSEVSGFTSPFFSRVRARDRPQFFLRVEKWVKE